MINWMSVWKFQMFIISRDKMTSSSISLSIFSTGDQQQTSIKVHRWKQFLERPHRLFRSSPVVYVQKVSTQAEEGELRKSASNNERHFVCELNCMLVGLALEQFESLQLLHIVSYRLGRFNCQLDIDQSQHNELAVGGDKCKKTQVSDSLPLFRFWLSEVKFIKRREPFCYRLQTIIVDVVRLQVQSFEEWEMPHYCLHPFCIDIVVGEFKSCELRNSSHQRFNYIVLDVAVL